jgi:hypothetical protein
MGYSSALKNDVGSYNKLYTQMLSNFGALFSHFNFALYGYIIYYAGTIVSTAFGSHSDKGP